MLPLFGQTPSPSVAGRLAAGRTEYLYTDDNLVAAVQTAFPGGSPAGACPAAPSGRVSAVCFVHDGEGRRVKASDALGHQATTAYTADGLVATRTGQPYGPISHLTQYGYDANANPVTVTDPSGNVTRTTYWADDLVRAVRQEDNSALVAVTAFAYDANANPVAITSPAANAAPRDANNTAGVPTAHSYTADNLLEATIEPVAADGSVRRRTRYVYDRGGRKVAVRVDELDAAGAPVAGRDGGTQRFGYFPNDRLAVQYGRSPGETISHGYDPAGHPVSIADSTSGLTVSASYTLDGLVRTVEDGAGRETRYSYDGTGKRAARADVDGTGTPVRAPRCRTLCPTSARRAG